MTTTGQIIDIENDAILDVRATVRTCDSTKIEIKTIIVNSISDGDEVPSTNSSIFQQQNQQLLIKKIKKVIKYNGAVDAVPIFLPGKNEDTTASQSLSQSSTTKSKSVFQSSGKNVTTEKLVEGVLRFFQAKDKQTQLTSILLKSWLYYFYHDKYAASQQRDADCNNNTSLPIVVLPRTEYKRPYIELNVMGTDNAMDGIDHDQKQFSTTLRSWWNRGRSPTVTNKGGQMFMYLPFSVSHQYPITALSFMYIEKKDILDHHDTHDEKSVLPMIGMDVVMFDDSIQKNSSVMDFLNTFKGSFTSWEWNQIVSMNDDLCNENSDNVNVFLVEFYLRWSMKEAYTKALGLGLGFEFKSFESRLIGFDILGHVEISDRCATLWDCILDKCKHSDSDIVYFSSQIHHFRKEDTEKEAIDDKWKFYFLPLSIDSESISATSVFSGCACVCVQTDNKDNIIKASGNGINCSRSNMTLSDIFQAHGIKYEN